MLICTKCNIECDERDKFCSLCGNPLVTGEKPIACQENMDEMKEEKGDQGQLTIPDPQEVRTESLQVASPKDSCKGKPITKRICPRCKIIYNRADTCIRCGSPLEEHIPSSRREEAPPPSIHEVEREGPLPTSMSEVKKEDTPLSYGLEERIDLQSAHRPEVKKKSSQKRIPQRQSLNQLPSGMMRKGSSSRKKQIKILRTSFEVVSIFLLISATGYLLWSLSSYFFMKQPQASPPIFKEVNHPAPPHSSPPTNSAAPVKESRKVGDKQIRESAGGMQEVEEIKNLLENIRQGNLKNNIDLFMSCYAPVFKDREGKKRETLETWENFNYLNLSYDLKSHSISGNIAHARIAWQIKFSPKTGGPTQESQTVLDVTFKRGDAGWKITEVKPSG